MIRRALRVVVLLPGLALSAGHAADAPPRIEVWKTASCGCCRAWVRHLEGSGFSVEVHEVADVTPVKQRLGVPPALSSCHTAVVDGYLVEGHVPAADILRLLKERSGVKGIFVPGMPAGSPGMEALQGERYDVLALAADGSRRVFSSHGP